MQADLARTHPIPLSYIYVHILYLDLLWRLEQSFVALVATWSCSTRILLSSLENYRFRTCTRNHLGPSHHRPYKYLYSDRHCLITGSPLTFIRSCIGTGNPLYSCLSLSTYYVGTRVTSATTYPHNPHNTHTTLDMAANDIMNVARRLSNISDMGNNYLPLLYTWVVLNEYTNASDTASDATIHLGQDSRYLP